MDATLKGSSANSYISVVDATQYFLNRPHSQYIEENDDFEKFLMHSTLILDSYIDWLGDKTTTEQALEWPRKNLYGVDEDTIPRDILTATCELALVLLDDNVLQSTGLADFESLKVSSIQLKISNNISPNLIPEHILVLISKYGNINSGLNKTIIRV